MQHREIVTIVLAVPLQQFLLGIKNGFTSFCFSVMKENTGETKASIEWTVCFLAESYQVCLENANSGQF